MGTSWSAVALCILWGMTEPNLLNIASQGNALPGKACFRNGVGAASFQKHSESSNISAKSLPTEQACPPGPGQQASFGIIKAWGSVSTMLCTCVQQANAQAMVQATSSRSHAGVATFRSGSGSAVFASPTSRYTHLRSALPPSHAMHLWKPVRDCSAYEQLSILPDPSYADLLPAAVAC